jgi:hypothetical protein
MTTVEKHDLVDLEITFLSGVDRPAQEPATVAVIKAVTVPNSNTTSVRQDKQETTVNITEADLAKATARVSELETANALLQKGIDRRDCLLALTDEQRRYFERQPQDEQALDVNKGKAAVIAKATALIGADTVVYKDLAGNEYRKSEDSRTVDAVRRADAATEKLNKSIAESQEVTLTKRAETVMKSLPGEVTIKAAVLRAVEGIAEETVRKGALDLLAAANKAGEFLTTQHVNSFGARELAPESAEAAIEKAVDDLFEKAPEKYNHSREVAYDHFLDTPAGAKLYKRALEESQTR